MKNDKLKQTREQRASDLLYLARALYRSAVNEPDSKRLEMQRQVALKLASLLNEAVETDGTLHPDLGLELLLFIELKADGNNEAANNFEQSVRNILDTLEQL